MARRDPRREGAGERERGDSTHTQGTEAGGGGEGRGGRVEAEGLREEASSERGSDEGGSSGPVIRKGEQGQGRNERGAGGSSGPWVVFPGRKSRGKRWGRNSVEEASWERRDDEDWSSGPVTREGKQGQGRGERA